MGFFLFAYIVSFIAWLAGYLPIWGGWFIIGPVIFPIIVILLMTLLGMGTVGSLFGLASFFVWLEERQNKKALKEYRNRVNIKRFGGK